MIDSTNQIIRHHLREGIRVTEALLEDGFVDVVGKVAGAITSAYRGGHKLILFGNGGSAADAQHLAAEFVGRYRLDRRPLAALALTVNTSALTAIGNDYEFNSVFARQLEALGVSGDVAIGISTSGKSANVIAALQVAKRMGLTTIALTGRPGNPLAESAEFCLCVPSQDTPTIQEAHITIGHILCELVEGALFPGRAPVRR
jgi:D-sedoheptulose 7-phosphate isomerase